MGCSFEEIMYTWKFAHLYCTSNCLQSLTIIPPMFISPSLLYFQSNDINFHLFIMLSYFYVKGKETSRDSKLITSLTVVSKS